MFTAEYNRSSTVQALAATKASMFDSKNPVLGTIGLDAGVCQVMTTKGIEAIAAAITDIIKALRAPCVSQRTTQIVVRMAMTVSKPVQPYLPYTVGPK